MTAGDQTRVTVTVNALPDEAFRLFTEEVDAWWRRGPKYRHFGGEHAIVAFEPGVGGRVFEQFGTGGPVHVLGEVLAWQPGERLVFEWRLANFAPGERTEVEVLFEAFGDSRTRVSVTHRGWAAIRADHPVRHGQPVADFIRNMGLWWGDQLTTYRLLSA
jgi:uncharacterized protein YndB with AHSA1/START domain